MSVAKVTRTADDVNVEEANARLDTSAVTYTIPVVYSFLASSAGSYPAPADGRSSTS